MMMALRGLLAVTYEAMDGDFARCVTDCFVAAIPWIGCMIQSDVDTLVIHQP